MSSALALALAARAGTRLVLTEHVGHVAYAQPALDRIQALAIGSLWTRVGAARPGSRGAQREGALGDGRPRRRGPVVTIANGVDTAAYRPPEPGEREALRAALGWDERPRVLFVGRLVAKKGIDLAIGAAQRAAGAFELVVAGPGRAPEVLPASVRVLGAQPPARVAELYRAADALVLPSHGEGFPIVGAGGDGERDRRSWSSTIRPTSPTSRVRAPAPAACRPSRARSPARCASCSPIPPPALPLASTPASRSRGPRPADAHEALYRSL